MIRIMLGAAVTAMAMLVPVGALSAAERGSAGRDDGFPAAGPRAPAVGRGAAAPVAAPEPKTGMTEVEKRLSALDRLRQQAGKGAMPTFQHVNDHENLRALFRRIRDLIRAGQYARAGALGGGLLPDEPRLKAGLRDGLSPAEVTRVLELQRRSLPERPEDVYKIFAPDNAASEVRLYRATTEELVSPPRNTAAKDVFPKNVQRTASELLRPGVTWYIVELAVPGADQGFRYHLIFFDGAQWTMLGPIWNSPR